MSEAVKKPMSPEQEAQFNDYMNGYNQLGAILHEVSQDTQDQQYKEAVHAAVFNKDNHHLEGLKENDRDLLGASKEQRKRYDLLHGEKGTFARDLGTVKEKIQENIGNEVLDPFAFWGVEETPAPKKPFKKVPVTPVTPKAKEPEDKPVNPVTSKLGTPDENGVYDWEEQDPNLASKPEPTEAEKRSDLIEKLLGAVETVKTTDREEIRNFAIKMWTQRFNEHARQEEWTQEEFTKYAKRLADYVNGKSDVPLEQVLQPTAEEIEAYSMQEKLEELGEDVNHALFEYIVAAQSKDQKAMNEAYEQIIAGFKIKASEAQWTKDNRKIRLAGLGKYMEDVTADNKPADQEPAVVAAPEKKKRFQGFRDRLKHINVSVGNRIAGVNVSKEQEENERKSRRGWLVGAVAVAGVAGFAYLNSKHHWFDLNPFDGDGLDLNPFNNTKHIRDVAGNTPATNTPVVPVDGELSHTL